MKKLFYTLAAGMFLFMVSCGGSVDSKIDRVAEIQQELKTIAQEVAQGNTENQEKIAQLNEELAKINAELQSADLTDEQKEKLTKAALGM